MQDARKRQRTTAMVVTTVVAGMIGLSFASVPLYRLFCQVTGYGGTPVVDAERSQTPVSNHTVRVSFDANTNRDLPWTFQPAVRDIQVRLGEEVLAHYRAHNDGNKTVTGTAVFNVAPDKVGQYFNKIDCFCFTEQTLEAGQTVDMPVLFYVDPAMLDDPDAFDVKGITLSYTFYPAEGGDDRGEQERRAKSAAETAQVDGGGAAVR